MQPEKCYNLSLSSWLNGFSFVMKTPQCFLASNFSQKVTAWNRSPHIIASHTCWMWPMAWNANVTAGALTGISDQEASWLSTLLEGTQAMPALDCPPQLFPKSPSSSYGKRTWAHTALWTLLITWGPWGVCSSMPMASLPSPSLRLQSVSGVCDSALIFMPNTYSTALPETSLCFIASLSPQPSSSLSSSWESRTRNLHEVPSLKPSPCNAHPPGPSWGLSLITS